MEEVTQPGAVFQSCRNINNPCPDADSWTTCRPWQPRHSCCQKSRDAVWKSISKHGVAARPTRRSCRNLSVSAAPPSLGQPHPLSSVDKSYALVGFPITGGAGVRMKPDLLIISLLILLGLRCVERKYKLVHDRRRREESVCGVHRQLSEPC